MAVSVIFSRTTANVTCADLFQQMVGSIVFSKITANVTCINLFQQMIASILFSGQQQIHTYRFILKYILLYSCIFVLIICSDTLFIPNYYSFLYSCIFVLTIWRVECPRQPARPLLYRRAQLVVLVRQICANE
jgi:hypothetical protein